jgi:hypothetical protein
VSDHFRNDIEYGDTKFIFRNPTIDKSVTENLLILSNGNRWVDKLVQWLLGHTDPRMTIKDDQGRCDDACVGVLDPGILETRVSHPSPANPRSSFWIY